MASATEIALVTGGAGDIGRAVTAALHRRGAHVLAADLAPADPAHIALDVTSPQQWDELIDRIARDHGRLDVLVNAAGIEGPPGRLWEQAPNALAAVMAVNAGGTFHGMRAALRLMRPAGRGAIVNVASVAGLVGIVGLAPYTASKHAVVGLTKTAAAELARTGIRVNAVCPGPVEGRMMGAIESGATPGDAGRARGAYEAAIPARRYGTPEEVAAVVASVSDPSASYLTGAIIPVDGAMTAI